MCEKKSKPIRPSDLVDWIMDSGASKHFTHELSDFAEYRPVNGPMLTTAAKNAPLQVKGEGTVSLTHTVFTSEGKEIVRTTRLSLVYYVPGMSTRLMSMGEILNQGYLICGSSVVMGTGLRTHAGSRVRVTRVRVRVTKP